MAIFSGNFANLLPARNLLCHVKNIAQSAALARKPCMNMATEIENSVSWRAGNCGRRKSAGQSGLVLPRKATRRRATIVAAVRQRER